MEAVEELAEEGEIQEVSARIVGILRRGSAGEGGVAPPLVLRFYATSEDLDNEETRGRIGHAVKELKANRRGWWLTVLGGLTTTQREYQALHGLNGLDPAILEAILRPSPTQFPQYTQLPPPLAKCFTPRFVQHLHANFNGPQLSAIQWAAAHTAAGSSGPSVAPRDGAGAPSSSAGLPTSSSSSASESASARSSKSEEGRGPFTLVQGPPGTGKTLTVWGMLNVIHLVQFQGYFRDLLRRLSPQALAAGEAAGVAGRAAESSADLTRLLPQLCPKPRILVCTPSNAAVDEVLARVLDRGFIDGELRRYNPDVARVGSDVMHPAGQAVSVEQRSNQLLTKSPVEVQHWLEMMRAKEAAVMHHIRSLQRELRAIMTLLSKRGGGRAGEDHREKAGGAADAPTVDPEDQVVLDNNRDTKLQQLAAAHEERDKLLVELQRLMIVSRHMSGMMALDEARGELEASFADEAEILFTTLSSSGRRIFTRLTHGFDMVVIDEAAQASELAILPPLLLKCKRCVLVGDPQQLPATVISRAAQGMYFSRSLFERLQQATCPSLMLTVQFRMHPEIRQFPSRYFYEGRLMDGESIRQRQDEVYYSDNFLRPYLFYDVGHGKESQGSSASYQNKAEAELALQLCRLLSSTIRATHQRQQLAKQPLSPIPLVGVITPYKQQLRCINKEFESFLANNPCLQVKISTIDSYQGQESDVIIMSCVRALSARGVGFVADLRRMNVALTRARRALWVLGSASTLSCSVAWAALIDDARRRSCFKESGESLQLLRNVIADLPPPQPVVPPVSSASEVVAMSAVPRNMAVGGVREEATGPRPPPMLQGALAQPPHQALSEVDHQMPLAVAHVVPADNAHVRPPPAAVESLPPGAFPVFGPGGATGVPAMVGRVRGGREGGGGGAAGMGMFAVDVGSPPAVLDNRGAGRGYGVGGQDESLHANIVTSDAEESMEVDVVDDDDVTGPPVSPLRECGNSAQAGSASEERVDVTGLDLEPIVGPPGSGESLGVGPGRASQPLGEPPRLDASVEAGVGSSEAPGGGGDLRRGPPAGEAPDRMGAASTAGNGSMHSRVPGASVPKLSMQGEPPAGPVQGGVSEPVLDENDPAVRYMRKWQVILAARSRDLL